MKKQKSGKLFCGTSGLALPVPNKLSYPPEYREGPRLSYYGSLFTSIEVNSSFYKLPQLSTVEKWTNQVPEDFVFTYKLSKSVTHAKQLAFEREDVEQFIERISGTGLKKGCILIQFPPSTRFEWFGKVEELLEIISPLAEGWKMALEFRHTDWYETETYELADAFGCSIVLHDIPKSLNQKFRGSADFVYLRLHGPTGNYRGSYSDEFLKSTAADINAWRRSGKTVFCYFNNTAGEAAKNALTLNQFLNKM